MRQRAIITDALVHRLFSEPVIRPQVDYVLPFLNFLLVGIALILFANHGKAAIPTSKLFLVLFSFFATYMMLIAWLHSQDLDRRVRKWDLERPDLTLYFVTWAIIVWQMVTVVNTPILFPSKVTRELISATFSSLNNMFLLWAAMDFEYEKEPFWKKWPLIGALQFGRPILWLGVSVIFLTVLIFAAGDYANLIGLDKLPDSTLLAFFIPDFLFSLIVSIILCIGFIKIFNSRYIRKITGPDQFKPVKKYVLDFTIFLIFFVAMMAQLMHVFPDFSKAFMAFCGYAGERLIRAEKAFQEVVVLSYRSFLTMLFFMLEISWVRLKKDAKEEKLNQDLHRRAEINRALRHEISHRLKNHLLMLAAKIEGQMDKPVVRSSQVADQELSATLGYVYATMQVHEALDNPKVNDNDNVYFYVYLRDLCERLKQLIRFPDGNYNYHLDENGVSIRTPYAEARTVGVILTELLINVSQHAYSYDSENKWVGITVERQNRHFVLRITDRGKGIEHFSDRKPVTSSEGRGLVLISDMVKRQLEGTLQVESGDNGTSVEITIPVHVLEVSAKNKAI